jgi:hypothetical protein
VLIVGRGKSATDVENQLINHLTQDSKRGDVMLPTLRLRII